jgi:hypothetical protein
MDSWIPNITSNAVAGPAGPSGASSYGDTGVTVGGITMNKKPDLLMLGAAFVLGGVAVWAYKNR